MNWKIEFPDGRGFTASSAEEALETWRLKSWHTWSPEQWPEVLAKRAYVWSGFVADPTLPAEEFLGELAKAGLVKVAITKEVE